MNRANFPLDVRWLGRVPYAAAWELQKEMVQACAAGKEEDSLLLLEHPPVYTLGRSGKLEHLLLDEAARARAGIELHHVDRGGDITYHGPGQLVGYPILDLKRLFQRRNQPRPDLHRYLRDIEEVLIRTLAGLGVRGWRYEGYTGVWVDGPDGDSPSKIAAIGIKVNSRGISSHGFALNVAPNLEHFAGIVPCGIAEHGVTSLAELTGRALAITDLIPPLVASFAELFEVELRFVAPPVSAYNQP